MTDKKTTLVDIYEAAGATVSEDRKTVTMIPGQMKPFEIILTVYPTGIEMEDPYVEKITFDIILNSEVAFGKTGFAGTPMYQRFPEADFSLPVDQVRILKKENND